MTLVESYIKTFLGRPATESELKLTVRELRSLESLLTKMNTTADRKEVEKLHRALVKRVETLKRKSA
jgi:hypothetical protein